MSSKSMSSSRPPPPRWGWGDGGSLVGLEPEVEHPLRLALHPGHVPDHFLVEAFLRPEGVIVLVVPSQLVGAEINVDGRIIRPTPRGRISTIAVVRSYSAPPQRERPGGCSEGGEGKPSAPRPCAHLNAPMGNICSPRGGKARGRRQRAKTEVNGRRTADGTCWRRPL